VTPRQRARLDASVASWEWDPATFALAVRLAGGEASTLNTPNAIR